MEEGKDYIVVKKTFLEGPEKEERVATMALLFEDVVYPEEYTGTLLNRDEHGDITVVHMAGDDCCIIMGFDEFTDLWIKWRTEFNLKLDKRLDGKG